ncbi:MAG: hypothetical protein AMS14_10980 [Planctomycetes bacterium DG_20]|nr:MAG: hypothetical protein AMS14_10980 [Planctomycetes bacterium DG_20]
MSRRTRRVGRLSGASVSLVALLPWALAAAGAPEAAAAEPSPAAEILAATGVKGGLVVHVGCGDGRLTAAFGAGEPYLVHGLDGDAKNVERAREYIRSLGLYGKVSVEHWTEKRLPYADNLVNLLVAERLGGIPMDEVMRVLCPNGVACIGGKKTVKPWPAEIDEWTHHLHDAGGNAVASDRVAGPPRHLQWTAGPRWARSHGYTPSTSVLDETLTCVDDTVPSTWRLVARDAFSGVLLWKRPLPEWGSKALSGTDDTGRGVTTGRFTMPPHVGKRLVAVGDTVYVTLGAGAPVTALDAATGRQRRVYAETARADEVLLSASSPSTRPPRTGPRWPPGASRPPPRPASTSAPSMRQAGACSGRRAPSWASAPAWVRTR